MSRESYPETRKTRTCEFVYDGVVIGRFLPGAVVTVDDAIENIAVTAELTQGRRVPVLVDLRHARSQSAQAREYLAGPEANKVSNAVALLIGSPISRALGNFYLGFNRPNVPTRLFTDENEARQWLTSFLNAP